MAGTYEYDWIKAYLKTSMVGENICQHVELVTSNIHLVNLNKLKTWGHFTKEIKSNLVFWTWSTNNPPPPNYFWFFLIRVGCFRLFLILAPAGGSYQTSFLNLQGILHGSSTLRAILFPQWSFPFTLLLAVKLTAANLDNFEKKFMNKSRLKLILCLLVLLFCL